MNMNRFLHRRLPGFSILMERGENALALLIIAMAMVGSSAFGANYYVVVFCKSVYADRALNACIIKHKFSPGRSPYPFLSKDIVSILHSFPEKCKQIPYYLKIIYIFSSCTFAISENKALNPRRPSPSQSQSVFAISIASGFVQEGTKDA